MPGVTLQDVIVPELFTPYVIKKTMEKSALVSSGIIVNNTEFDRLASQASPMVTMPFFEDLTGESEAVIEGKELTPDGINSKADISAIIRRAKAWSATDLSAALAGRDPMEAIASLVAGFWARDMQKELVAILNGVFGSYTESDATKTPMAEHILDISTGSGNAAKWSGAAYIDAEQLMGDAKTELSGICMHSAVEAALKKQNLIETVQPSNDVAFGTYQGKRVIVDDGCPFTGSGANMVFSTYLFGSGAVALGNGNPVGFVPTETDRKKLMGSGVDFLINRRTNIMHPRGIAFTGAVVANPKEGPTRTELANAKNWNPVYEMKQIRIVEFRHKI